MPRIVTPDGRVIELPPGTTEADVAANPQKYDLSYGKSGIDIDDPNPPKNWRTGKSFPPGIARGTEELARGVARGVAQDATALGNLSPGHLVSRGIDKMLGHKPVESSVERWANDPNISTTEGIGRFVGAAAPMLATPELGLGGLAEAGVAGLSRAGPGLGTLAAMWKQPWLWFARRPIYNNLSGVAETVAPVVGRVARDIGTATEAAAKSKALRTVGGGEDDDEDENNPKNMGY